LRRADKAEKVLRLLAFALACLLGPIAAGATSPKDLKIGIHVIDFVTNAPSGRTGFGIIYDSRSRESLEDAQAIMDSLSAPALKLPDGLKPVLIDIKDLDQAGNLRVLVVADHMKAYYDQLADYGRRTHTLALSSDLDCVRSGRCTVGIVSGPRVEVIVSTRQAQASGIQFSEAFRMMVTEY
jgi:hypothetical protein